jgi:hypothetical protein
MRRVDLLLVLILLSFATFVGVEVISYRPAPRANVTPAPTPTTHDDAIVVGAARLPAPERDVATIRATLSREASGTYIDDLLAMRDSTLARWIARPDDPVRVWVDERASLTEFDSGFPSDVRRAFASWGAAGLPLRFNFVSDSAGAEVRVTFRSRFDEVISGRTRWVRDPNGWILGGDIALALRTPSDAPVTRDQLYAIALHEIGHLLGLDHTRDSLAIMSPRVRVTELAPVDVATLRLVYRVPPGPLRLP